jgi:2-polyprenyl-3-methyl-5-hydroxy-6-metoxy-1,4-benzoquinol methylase
VSRHFDDYGEKEWDRLTRSVVDEVNLHIHTELLKRHLRGGMEVLEVGAGAGRFTQIIAGLGCRISVIDISEKQLALNWETELAEIRQDAEKWSELLRLESEACVQPGCWDSGTHMIEVCRKMG